MIGKPPYVVLVTSPSSGVGKSTLARNLAVYLRALDEERPIAYAALDIGSDAESMFRLGRSGQSIEGLFRGEALPGLLTLGEYGVEYANPPSAFGGVDSGPHARRALTQSDYDGILLLEADADGPFIRAGIEIADLILVPVRDPSALPAVTRLQQVLLSVGGVKEQLWVVPSELGEANFRQADVLEDFLRFAAEERGFQIFDGLFVAEPEVQGLADQPSRSILTRLPQGRLHQQLRQVATLILEQRRIMPGFQVRIDRWIDQGSVPTRARRMTFRCPLCGEPVSHGAAHYLEAYPARRRLLLHRQCLALLLEGTAALAFYDDPGLLLAMPSAAHAGSSDELTLQVFDEQLFPINSEFFVPGETSDWHSLLQVATGRCLAELYREMLLVSAPAPLAELLSDQWQRRFAEQRKRLRTSCREENI